MTDSLILRTVVRAVFPLLIIFAILLYLAGHNAPGGGFIAGLLTGAAIVLRYIAQGRERSKETPAAFTKVVACGLALGLGTAVAPTFLGHAFFTHTFGYVHLPLIGKFEWATASLFDLGVYVVVVGNVVTILRAMTDPE